MTFEQFEQEATLSARWVVDAAGRASILKRKLDLMADCGHHINSAWLRLGGGLDLESWGADDAEWMARMSKPGIRQFSTNHLMGEGYWVWMIPLSTGPISIGVCADPRLHPYEEINELERLLGWMRKHEPQLAASIEERPQDIEDFLRVKDFAYGVKQMFSTDRWALVGEAGAFADPFYSPGSDFIGYSNTFTADLVTRDLNGEQIGERADYYNDLYQRLFAHVISRYRDSYQVFGNAWVMCGLLTWDFYSNHAGSVLLFTQNKFTDIDFMRRADEYLDRLFKLNINMHKLFREWHELEHKPRDPDILATFPVLLGGLVGLVKEYPDEEALLEELRTNVRNSEAMAVAIFNQAAQALPEGPPADRPINPYALSLDPTRWEADGLFEEPGLTIEQARGMVRGDRRYVGLLACVCGRTTSRRRRTARRRWWATPGRRRTAYRCRRATPGRRRTTSVEMPGRPAGSSWVRTGDRCEARIAERFDVVVVGARCAGSPLAALLAHRGLRVAVVEKATVSPRHALHPLLSGPGARLAGASRGDGEAAGDRLAMRGDGQPSHRRPPVPGAASPSSPATSAGSDRCDAWCSTRSSPTPRPRRAPRCAWERR